MEGEKRGKWPWPVPSREEKLKYQQQLLKFEEKVKRFCSGNYLTWNQLEKQDNSTQTGVQRLSTESPATSVPTLCHAFTAVSLSLHGEQSGKFLSPDESKVACANLQADLMEISSVGDSDKAPEDTANTETEEKVGLEADGGTAEVKRTALEGELQKSPEGQMSRCTKCEKIFTAIWELAIHYETDHLEKTYKCDICNDAVFKSAATLRTHKKECQNKFVKKSFVRNVQDLLTVEENSTLQTQLHSIAPSTMNRFSCDICPKLFSNIYTLKEHKDVAHFGKRYCCRFCEKEFCNRSYFQRHKKECRQNKTAK